MRIKRFVFAWAVLSFALLPLGPAAGQDTKVKAQALFKQAFELFQAGDYDAAALGFKEGLALDPASGLGHFYLAETYARQDRLDLALPHYEQTAILAPDSKEALIVRSRLQQLKGKAEGQAALRKWVGKWRHQRSDSIMEVKSAGSELTMVWIQSTNRLLSEFRPGELYAKGSLKGSNWQGKVGRTFKDPNHQRCFGGEPQDPMIAMMSQDGTTITMWEGNFVWDDIDTCRIAYYRTPEENQRKDPRLYTQTFTRVRE